MANEYFEWPDNPSRFERFDTVRSTDANDALDQVTQGFDGVAEDIQALEASINPEAAIGHSTTSLAVGSGDKTFTMEADLAFGVGQFVNIADDAAPATNQMRGRITAYNRTTGVTTVRVTETDGSGTIAAWTITLGTPTLGRGDYISRATNTSIDDSNYGDYIQITGAGNFTQTVGALTAGTWFDFENAAADAITWAASDGVSNWKQYPGEVRRFRYDGASLQSVVLKAFAIAFTASGTFTKPPRYNYFSGMGWGDGGGGGKTTSGAVRCGGGGGGPGVPFEIDSSIFGASETITIGTGGLGATTSTVGANGSGCSIGSILTFPGGGGGGGGGSDAAGGGGGGAISSGNTAGGSGNPRALTSAAGTASSGESFGGAFGAASSGGSGANGYYGGGGGGSGNAGAGGASQFGGGGGGGVISTGAAGAGGVSKFGGNGGAAGLSANGTDGTAPGGGGGATYNGARAGNGARGEIRITGRV
jgi:hypothetical protein